MASTRNPVRTHNLVVLHCLEAAHMLHMHTVRVV